MAHRDIDCILPTATENAVSSVDLPAISAREQIGAPQLERDAHVAEMLSHQ